MQHAASERAPGSAADRCAVLVLAIALDLLFGEPPAPLHPVVWLGAAIDRLEQQAPPAHSRASAVYGALAATALDVTAAAAALLAERAAGRLRRPLRLLLLATLLKPSFSLRLLLRSGRAVGTALERNQLASARLALRALVSRDASGLSAAECAAAAIESLAENTSDSFIAAWLSFAVCGLPGPWVFRTANTLDSRWGYHGRYELLGRAAARIDDLLACLPARLSAILLIVAAPAGGGSPVGAWRCVRRDRARTESPNAGWTMAAMAGALGRQLSKPGHYVLNPVGAPSRPADIWRAERIVAATAALAALTALGSMLVTRRSR